LSPAVDESARPPDFPDRIYRDAAAAGQRVFRVDSAHSLVTVEVRRGGALARLGHDHVVASHDVRGFVLPDAGRADLYVPLDRLVVDEPSLRAEAGFDTRPSADDIAGTQRNMRERVLEIGRYPIALIAVRDVARAGDVRAAEVSITLHGVTRALRVPLHVSGDATTLQVGGDLQFDQSSFGIVPLSILGGAITVQDDVRIRTRIRAIAQDPG
jgi:hypothetical protein